MEKEFANIVELRDVVCSIPALALHVFHCDPVRLACPILIKFLEARITEVPYTYFLVCILYAWDRCVFHTIVKSNLRDLVAALLVRFVMEAWMIRHLNAFAFAQGVLTHLVKIGQVRGEPWDLWRSANCEVLADQAKLRYRLSYILIAKLSVEVNVEVEGLLHTVVLRGA